MPKVLKLDNPALPSGYESCVVLDRYCVKINDQILDIFFACGINSYYVVDMCRKKNTHAFKHKETASVFFQACKAEINALIGKDGYEVQRLDEKTLTFREQVDRQHEVAKKGLRKA